MAHHGGYLKYVSKRFKTFHMPFFGGAGCSWKQSQCQPIIPNFCLKHRTKNERLPPGHWTCERSLVHHIYSFDAVLAGSAGSNPCPGKCCSRCRRNIVPEKKVKRPRSHGVWRMDFGKMPWCKHQVSDCKWCQTNLDADHPLQLSVSQHSLVFLPLKIQPSVLFWHIMLHLWVVAKPTAVTVITSRLSSIHSSQSVHDSSQPPTVAVRHSPGRSEVANMHAGYVIHNPVQIVDKYEHTGTRTLTKYLACRCQHWALARPSSCRILNLKGEGTSEMAACASAKSQWSNSPPHLLASCMLSVHAVANVKSFTNSGFASRPWHDMFCFKIDQNFSKESKFRVGADGCSSGHSTANASKWANGAPIAASPGYPVTTGIPTTVTGGGPGGWRNCCNTGTCPKETGPL